MLDVVTAKRCTRCKHMLPLDDFSPNRTHKDGRQSACRTCVAAANRERRTDPAEYDKHRRTVRARTQAMQAFANDHPKAFAPYLAKARAAEGLNHGA